MQKACYLFIGIFLAIYLLNGCSPFASSRKIDMAPYCYRYFPNIAIQMDKVAIVPNKS